MAPIASSYVTITADFSVFRDSARRHAREAGEDAARTFARSFEADLRARMSTRNNMNVDVQARLDLSVFLPQWRVFAATFLNRVWHVHVQPNMDPNHLRLLNQAAARAGAQAGGFMSTSLSDTLGKQLPSLMSPIGLAIGAAIAVSAAPAIGAAIVGAVLLAVGGGVLAAGIASAARDPAVKAAFEPLKRTATTVFTEMGQAFRQPLINSLGIFEQALQDMRPVIREIFGNMANVVEPLSKGLADMAKNSLPGIRDAAAAARPIFEAIAEKLPALGDAISKFFSGISEGGGGAKQFFEDFFDFLIATLPVIGKALGDLADAWGFFRGFVIIAINEVSLAWMVAKNSFEAVRLFFDQALKSLVVSYNVAKTGILTVINAVRDAWSAAWNFLRDQIFAPMVRFITETVPAAWRRGVDLIGFWWNALRDLAAKPVRFVIETVINKGIIGTFNKVADFLPGLPRIGEIPMPAGLAAGGYFDGRLPGAPSDDDNMVAVGPNGRALGLASGEFVVKAKQTAKHLGLLHAINDGKEGFADGGLIGAILNPAGWVKDRIEGLINNIPGGGFMKSAAVGMGRRFVDALIDYVKSKLSFFGSGGSAPAGFPPWPSSPGASRGDSGVWRLIVALINSTGPVSGSFGNAYRAGDPLWHGSGRAVDWMGYNQDVLATFLAARRPLELIHRTVNRDYAYTRGVNKGSFNNALMEQHRNHVHIAMARGGLLGNVPLYAGSRVMDNGGWMYPGWNPPTYNGTGRLEAVVPDGMSVGLTESTLDRLAAKIARSLAAALTGATQASIQIARARA